MKSAQIKAIFFNPKGFSVEGTSMLPLLHPGERLIFEPVKFPQIRVNDLILFNKSRHYTVHRVVYKSKNYLITKGDHNPQTDGKIKSSSIIGRVVYIKKQNRQLVSPDTVYLAQSTLYLQEINRLQASLEWENVVYVFIKGLPVHLHYERRHPRRFYFDCDLLVASSAVATVQKHLQKQGYRKIDKALSTLHARLKNQESEFLYYQRLGALPVFFDVHSEVVFLMTELGTLNSLYPSSLVKALTQTMLAGRRRVKFAGVSYFLLSPLHQILYLALHLFHHNYQGSFRYELLHRIMKTEIAKHSFTWLDLSRLIREYQLQNYLYPAFVLLQKYYHTGIHPRFLGTLRTSTNRQRWLSLAKINIFAEETRVKAGIKRFIYLFLLSPRPVWVRLLVFFEPLVGLTIIFLFCRSLTKSVTSTCAWFRGK